MTLNVQQLNALNLMLQGDNVFITAPAGTGKTFLINHFCSTVKEEYPTRNIALTSTTGVSAVLIGGSTLHSYLGIGLGEENVENMTKKILFSGPAPAPVRGNGRREGKGGLKADIWKKLDVLVIDEISMLSPILFDKLEHVARNVRGNDLPFGGIQLILSGDLLQLPVVKGGIKKDLIIDAKSWSDCIGENVIFLKEIMRQNDPLFKEILLKIRIGNIDDQVKTVLSEHAPEESHSTNNIKPTRLFCLKKYVQNLNEIELRKLQTKGNKFFNFTALIKPLPDKKCSEAQFKFLSDRFVSNATTPENLRICEEAQVMLTFNANTEAGLVNGSRGIITGFSGKKFPIVKFMNGVEMEVEPHLWEISNDFGKKVGYFKQIPLKIAYALTIHSCQGATLDNAEVDLSDAFEFGQIYTALSRTKDLKSLTIKNLDFNKIKCHPRALKFYEDLE